jgi:hypothetical protein
LPARATPRAPAPFTGKRWDCGWSGNPFALVFDVNGTMLRVTGVPEMVPAKYSVLGWQVTDIEAAVRDLQQSGVAFERYDFPQDEPGIWQAPSGAKVAWFKDPDGNVLSLSQP